MTDIVNDPERLMSLILCFCAIGTTISACEWIALKKQLQNNGLFSWTVSRLIVLNKAPKWKTILVDCILKYPTVLIILYLQIVFSLLILVFFGKLYVQGMLSLGMGLCYFLISYRRANGFNGGDSMAKIIILTCGICFLAQNLSVIKLGLFFITFQIILAYVTPGIIRIKDKEWLNGIKLMHILRTESFSKENVYNFYKTRPNLAKITSFSLVVFECFFIIAIFLPVKILVILLILGALFHILNALIMGLNTFIWSFIGAYPALIWTSIEVQKIL